MIVRYAEQSEAFALRLFPHYRGQLRRGNTSFRPLDVAGRARSWRQDDTRLHVDAFPSNPMQGTRLLRVFCNVNPNGEPRRWRVGESFEAHARRYLGAIGKPWPGSAWLLATLGITKRRRTGYDHLMLQLHDRAKADAEFQRASPQQRVDFAPGTTWVCFSDQVLHAAMGGQHMMEQTFYLDARRPRPSGECAAGDPRAADRPSAARMSEAGPLADGPAQATPRSRLGLHLHPFRPRLLDALAGYDRRRFAADCGAGITVGIVALPLAMAFAIASGVKPEQGIFTAIIAGFLISALGGSSVQIGGPAGAFIVIVYGIVQRYGVANLLIATVLAGCLLLALGWLRLGALVRYIPVSIVIGFTNGIAVLIAVSQVKDLLGLHIGNVPADFFAQAPCDR